MYVLNKKMYTNDIISTVKSNLHYFFLKKPLILICLRAPFLFKLKPFNINDIRLVSFGDVVSRLSPAPFPTSSLSGR
jgi:hypothetical protein